MADLSNALGITGALTSPTFTYAPEDIQIILHTATDSGQQYEHLVHGFIEGTFLEVRALEELTKSPAVTTMDGRTQRLSRNFSTLYEVVITLTQSSISNSQIQQMMAPEFTTYKGDFVRQSITIKDQKGGVIIGPATCWVESYPVVAYSSGIESRQWTLKVHSPRQIMRIRGNASEFEFSGILGDIVSAGKGLAPSLGL